MRGVRGAQNGTTLHQNSRIPGGGDFLPKFLPKRRRSGIEMSYLRPVHATDRPRAAPAPAAATRE
jgi:hypothetical protein